MSLRRSGGRHGERGVGLMEVMISIVIGMLLVVVIYQVYEISESQKRTITSGSDAQQNASYSMYVLGRDVSMAGNGIASTAAALDGCTALRPIPVLIEAGASGDDPDKITVLYGGSPSLSTPVPFRASATGTAAYVVPAPVGFSANDVIAAVQGTDCTISTINAGGIAVDPGTGFATIAHTPVAGSATHTFTAGVAALVNLGQAASMGRVEYTVDPATHALRAQNLLPDPAAAAPPAPIINDVVNLKAQYGVNAKCDGVLVWTDPTGAWSSANLPAMPLPTGACAPGVPSLRQIQAIRIVIVTRSTQYEKEAVTPQLPLAMPAGKLGLFCDPAPTCAVSMNLSADDQHYRYKVLETAIPLRNALWN
jgi:type IV pilus assembly protein PilW